MRKMKHIVKIICFLSLVFVFKTSVAQHLSMYDIHTQNRFVYNPANAGDIGQAFVHVRQEWVGINGRPDAYTFGIQGPLGEKRTSGLGLLLSRQEMGVQRVSRGILNYSYKAQFNDANSITFGIGGGFFDARLVQADIRAYDPTQIINEASDGYEGMRFDAALGVKYNWKNKFELSVALPRVLERDYKLNRYFVGIASYNLFVADEKLHIQPSVLYRSNEYEQSGWDFNLYACWDQTLWLGAGYRNNPYGTYIFQGGVNFYNVGIGYAYEANVENIETFSNGTHEVILSYVFDKRKKQGNKELLNNNQLELLLESDSAQTDDDLQAALDSLRKEIETLKKLLGDSNLGDWAKAFQEKIDIYDEQIGDIMNKKTLKPVYFDIDKYDIRPAHIQDLDDVVSYMKANPRAKIEVIGHADDTGPNWYNMDLSNNRAKIVLDYLVNKGADKNAFIVIGRGEDFPVASGTTPEARQLNRVVEFRVVK